MRTFYIEGVLASDFSKRFLTKVLSDESSIQGLDRLTQTTDNWMDLVLEIVRVI